MKCNLRNLSTECIVEIHKNPYKYGDMLQKMHAPQVEQAITGRSGYGMDGCGELLNGFNKECHAGRGGWTAKVIKEHAKKCGCDLTNQTLKSDMCKTLKQCIQSQGKKPTDRVLETVVQTAKEKLPRTRPRGVHDNCNEHLLNFEDKCHAGRGGWTAKQIKTHSEKCGCGTPSSNLKSDLCREFKDCLTGVRLPLNPAGPAPARSPATLGKPDPTPKKRGCTYQEAPKYHTKSRGSPPYPGNECRGMVMKGNDGRMYESRPVAGGKYWRWFVLDEKASKGKAKARDPRYPKTLLKDVMFYYGENKRYSHPVYTDTLERLSEDDLETILTDYKSDLIPLTVTDFLGNTFTETYSVPSNGLSVGLLIDTITYFDKAIRPHTRINMNGKIVPDYHHLIFSGLEWDPKQNAYEVLWES
uniref:Uncharacterized protein n=1 Tax=viral metagenome TaxID=1070528 RepID=A0A6C0CKK9_9ZZZZ